jgi:ligand-binding sensor domain-containing protein
MRKFLMLKSLFILLLFASNILPQINTWQVFSNDDIGISNTRILYIAEDLDGIKWIGTFGDGLIEYNGSEWIVHNSNNSPLLNNNIWTITVDSSNNKWIGTYGNTGGLVKYDGENWTVYNLDEYGIEGTSVFDIEIDNSGNFLMGSYRDGLIKFDGSEFSIFDYESSGLSPNMEEINCIAIDDSGYIWIGSDFMGGARFDGISEWVHYFGSDSTVDFAIYSLEKDDTGDLWFGGVNFLSQYN